MGGCIHGGRILGQYPNNITDDSELSLGRGRLMPTTSWESVFNGIAQWIGVPDEQKLDYCLPNRGNVVGGPLQLTELFTEQDLYTPPARRLRGGSNGEGGVAARFKSFFA